MFRKIRKTTLGTKEPEVPEPNLKENEEDDDDEWGLSLPKSSPRRSPPRKRATLTMRKKTTPKKNVTVAKLATTTASKRSFATAAAMITKNAKLEEAKLPPISEEREEAYSLLDSIKTATRPEMDGIVRTFNPNKIRKTIRFAKTMDKDKQLTGSQQIFLRMLDHKVKHVNPHIRTIHKTNAQFANEKINWTPEFKLKKTTKSSSSASPSLSALQRGIIIIVHTHGGFVKSNNLINYIPEVNDTLQSVSTFYLSDIGASVCTDTRENYKKFDEKFLSYFTQTPVKFSINEISASASESLKNIELKSAISKPAAAAHMGVLGNYFEPGVYNLAVSTRKNNIPFLNKKYSCGKKHGTSGGYDTQSIQALTSDGLKPLSEIINRQSAFNCQDEYSSITTLELLGELSKVIDDLEHVLIIDTSCSPFTPSIIKELFAEMPPESTPHKHRKTGLFKMGDNSMRQTLEPYFPDLIDGGGKKIKKTKKNHRHHKNKKQKKTFRKKTNNKK
jgi:hypothetical protein